MSEQVTKNDLNELKSEMTALKELYEKELEREKTERDLQAARDSDEAQILAQEVEAAKQEKAQEKESLESFRSSVLAELEGIQADSETDLNASQLEALNKNIETLIEYQEYNAQKSMNLEFLGTAAIGILILFVSGYILYKIGGQFSKILKIF